MDGNGNGHLSLAEVDGGIQKVLRCEALFNSKPVVMRAFQAAKNLDGKDSSTDGEYLQLKEFRAFLSYLRQYFEYYVMFQRMDTSGDGRMDLDEFKQAVALIESWGAHVESAEAAFREMDEDGSVVLCVVLLCR